MIIIEIFRDKVNNFRKLWEKAKNTQDKVKQKKLINQCKKISEDLSNFAYGEWNLVGQLKISVNDFVQYFKIKKIKFRTSDKVNDPVFSLYTEHNEYLLGKNLGASFRIYGLFDDVINFGTTNYQICYEGCSYLYDERRFKKDWRTLYEDYPDLEEYLWEYVTENIRKDLIEVDGFSKEPSEKETCDKDDGSHEYFPYI